jgi:hypothetical protein
MQKTSYGLVIIEKMFDQKVTSATRDLTFN